MLGIHSSIWNVMIYVDDCYCRWRLGGRRMLVAVWWLVYVDLIEQPIVLTILLELRPLV